MEKVMMKESYSLVQQCESFHLVFELRAHFPVCLCSVQVYYRPLVVNFTGRCVFSG